MEWNYNIDDDGKFYSKNDYFTILFVGDMYELKTSFGVFLGWYATEISAQKAAKFIYDLMEK